jgi:phosphate transport system protein
MSLLADDLVEMGEHVESAIGRACTALLTLDLDMAQKVVADDEHLDTLERRVDERCVLLIAQQQPVGLDLRTLVTSLRISAGLERMGDLARHVAKVARLRYPESAVPAELRATILQMGQVAERIVEKAGSVIAARDVEAAHQIERDDDAMDDLHRELFARVTDANWQYGTEAAVDITLLGRYYERFADHAVSVGHRVIWLVTGEFDPASEQSHEDVEDGAAALR